MADFSRQQITANEWRQIVDAALETAVISTDAEGRITSWNRGAENILGWSSKEMLGQTLERVFPDQGAKALEKEMADALSLGKGGGEEGWRVRKGGSLIWAVGELSPIRDAEGNAVGFTKILRDRSLFRKSEEAIIELNNSIEINPGDAFIYQTSRNFCKTEQDKGRVYL